MSADVSLPDAAKPNFKKVLRLVYAIVLFGFTVLTAVAGHAEHLRELADDFYSALNTIDPFVITARWWNHTLWDWDTVHDLTQGGLLAAFILAGAVAIGYRVLGEVCTANVEAHKKLWFSFLLSGLVAFPLKMILLGLTAAFGMAMGFVIWINAMIIGVIELFLVLHHVHKGASAVKEAAKEAAEVIKSAH
jgi:hypothetical protein